jgi:two-component system, OmpR family, sensor histidine kinase CiaH
MFKSARVKLTLFYLIILALFSLIATSTIRVLAEREYLHSNMVQRGEVRQLIFHGFGVTGRPEDAYIDLQEDQAAWVRQRLNEDMLMINVAALAISGVMSWWFAGRTLKPIEEAHLAQARFASDASHELRTPLTNMRLENEVFLRQKHFSETDAREQIESNLEEVQRLESLSGNLLALTQYGQTPLNLQPLAIKDVVKEAVKVAEKVAEPKKAKFENKVEQMVVIGHRDSLVQLVDILLDNAVKYGPQKGTVTIGGRKDDGHYLLWVQDEGPGIDDNDLPHIFDRLYRGDKARTGASGFGLGLSLAQAIAKANGAELQAQKLPDKKGACFLLRLPLAK